MMAVLRREGVLVFVDRKEAGQLLAKKLSSFHQKEKSLILALPRGGVPIGYEIAKALNIPLDIFLVRKLGVPSQPELAFGAIAEGDVMVTNPEVIRMAGVTLSQQQRVIAEKKEELAARSAFYRKGKPLRDLTGLHIILVDDGIATGATVKAAIKALQTLPLSSLTLAIPVAAKDSLDELSKMVDKVVCLEAPVHFYAVGYWYESFPQVSDEEVKALLTECEK